MMKKIKDMSLFKNIGIETIEKLIKENQISIKTYNKGKTVYDEEEICLGMDLVLSGELVSYSLAPNGSETILFQFREDNIIGANILFGENNHYPMNIYARENSVMLHILKPGVEELLKEYDFVMKFLEAISMNSQSMNTRISMCSQKSLRENIIDYFTELSEQQESKIIRLPTTKKELSDYFGVQRPSLFRELKNMKDEELIDVNNRVIKLNFLEG